MCWVVLLCVVRCCVVLCRASLSCVDVIISVRCVACGDGLCWVCVALRCVVMRLCVCCVFCFPLCCVLRCGVVYCMVL